MEPTPGTSTETILKPEIKAKKKRVLTVRNVYDKKFKTITLTDQWQAAIGKPQFTGCWFIYGPPKQGKTTFALMLSKYLTSYGKVLFITAEEGISLAFKKAVKRHKMEEVEGRWFAIDSREVPTVSDLIPVLQRQRGFEIIFMDSVWFYRLSQKDYRTLKRLFPDKLFVYISHVNNNGEPKGATADEIWRDSMVYFKVNGFRAFPVSRYGGGQTIDVFPERAAEYWGRVAN